MIYRDGYETDKNLRFVSCPRCGNEEYSEDAKYCRICGFSAYNECDGSPEYDKIMQQGLNSSTMRGRLQIAPAFIDLNYADGLRANLKDYPGVKIVSGAYEDTIDELLKNKGGCNVFLYIDPYGIRHLTVQSSMNLRMGSLIL